MIYIIISLLLLFIVALYKNSICKSTAESAQYLSLYNTNQIKGFFALLILLHHICQILHNDFGFFNMGPLAVSIFFFFSGYGLMYKLTSDSTYLSTFFKKRILKIFFPFICVYILNIFIHYTEGKTYTLIEILKSFVNGCPFAMWLWFVIFLLMFYIVFWVLAMITNKHPNKIMILSTVFLIIWCIFCAWRKFSPSWTLSCFSIVLGMLWRVKEDNINKKNVTTLFSVPIILLNIMLRMPLYIYPCIISVRLAIWGNVFLIICYRRDYD